MSTNDVVDDDKAEVEEDWKAPAKKRRHSEEDLEDGELKNKKKGKPEKGADRAFFIGIDLGDLSDDDDEEEEADESAAKKKKVSQKSK